VPRFVDGFRPDSLLDFADGHASPFTFASQVLARMKQLLV
jgi:hypothetical protein